MRSAKTWIMADVETSGPVYGRHSLLEIGAAFGSREAGVTDLYEALVAPISDEALTSRAAFERAKERGLPPAEAMRKFWEWCAPKVALGAELVARPAAFDWPWIVHYAWTYLGQNPFGFKAVCASAWMQALGKRFPVRLSHVAVQDAETQLRHFLKRAARSPRAWTSFEPLTFA